MGYAREKRLSWRRVGEQTVIVDAEAKRLYGLNAAAGVIWHALDGARSAEALSELFEAGDAPAAAERRRAVGEFLEALEREGLVGRCPQAVPTGERPAGEDLEARSAWAVPEVSWREQIQTFARACAFLPGINEVCIPNPRS